MTRPSPQTERVVALVELLASHPAEPFTLASVTRRLGINKSTSHSMLSTLTDAGWLVRDPLAKTYRLGPALAAVSRAAAKSYPALDFAHSAMVELSIELRAHCAALSVGTDDVTVVDQVRDIRAVGTGLPIGAKLPLRPPFGSVVLAWSPESVERWLAHVPVDTHDRYRGALEATRLRGFAVEITTTPESRLREVVALLRERDDRVPMPDLIDELARQLAGRDDVLPLTLDAGREYIVSALNAPVFDQWGRVTLVLSVTGFATPLSGRRVISIGERLANTTKELTTALGGASNGQGAAQSVRKRSSD